MLQDDRPRRPLLRYPGAKNQLAAWILAHIPQDHDTYNEPYVGSAAVLTAKGRSPLEAVNDASGDLINFLITLRERPDELIGKLRFTFWSSAELTLAVQPCSDPLERARRFYVRCYMAIRPFDKWPAFRRQKVLGRGRDGTSSPMSSAAQLFMDLEHLWWYAERLRGVSIEQMEALDFIQLYDHPRAVFYVDPPYVLDTRSRQTKIYQEDSMTGGDHEALADVMNGIQGMALVSGYATNRDGSANELYADLFDQRGWRRIDRQARIDGGGSRTESLWLSPSLTDALAREVRQETANLRQRYPLLYLEER
ncbi:MAG: DNA adenine methylase [Anaerolinea sp.]|nr:DNA adenine methylase [Anaerolinea sp.]